ncbi:hypothetical protein KIPB_009622, partial [Kipferlia bialata]
SAKRWGLLGTEGHGSHSAVPNSHSLECEALFTDNDSGVLSSVTSTSVSLALRGDSDVEEGQADIGEREGETSLGVGSSETESESDTSVSEYLDQPMQANRRRGVGGKRGRQNGARQTAAGDTDGEEGVLDRRQGPKAKRKPVKARAAPEGHEASGIPAVLWSERWTTSDALLASVTAVSGHHWELVGKGFS